MKLFSIEGVKSIINIGVVLAFMGFFDALPAQAAMLEMPVWVEDLMTKISIPDVEAEDKPIENGVEMASIMMGNVLVASNMPVTVNTNPIRYATSKIRVQPGTTFDLTVTAYSSTVDQTDSSPFITASGTHVHDGTVAANFLPFGTHVTFPDYFDKKIFTIEDRTNKKYSSRADIWMETRGAALQFGKRHLKMVVVE